MRVVYRGKSMRGWYTQRGKSQERKRIMNRLFISFSSVKLLRMARPMKFSISFLILCTYMYTTSTIVWEYIVFYYVLFNLVLQPSRIHHKIAYGINLFFRIRKNLYFISLKKYFIFTIICHMREINQRITSNLINKKF